mgnify:CR=1 FL=1
MPEGKSIYDVAFAGGHETGKYGAELLKTEDIWERMAHKGKVTDWRIERETAMADTAMVLQVKYMVDLQLKKNLKESLRIHQQKQVKLLILGVLKILM